VTGTKIFITAGEHDLTENIIHLVLAKLPDAPAGSRGISLFLVPKILVDEAGALGARNAVACGSLEHKMGIKGAATCVMNFDGAVGYLVGEVNKGLAAMFTMMNYERLGVGIQGLGSSERSYQNALAYARERLQSRSPAGIQQAAKNADPIIVHPDVRRMLLTMKALNEGGRLFSSYVALQLDTAKYSPEPAERERAEALVALLTPVAKGFLTDLGLELCVAGQQVFGGHGYIREWGMEQYVRDARIAQIYEGTNGVQAMDLVGRKLPMAGGAVVGGFFDLIEADVRPHADLPVAARTLSALAQLRQVTETLRGAGADAVGAAAVDYLRLFALVAMGWMWTRMAAAATSDSDLHRAKRIVASYYADRVMPQADGLAASILAGETSMMALPAEAF
ncbi:acyl-CoA dehydrogenase C-terminal domain-containing protein, partial [uncultured Massilia sp.]|uniref:acyl-CoA dehydrogenase C-terminal domain-containing protein n=1 Tax=uncultured Massilia sp. TaxID=169973 RepID=UPI002586C4D4